MSQAAYSNPPTGESGKIYSPSGPSLEVLTIQEPRKCISDSALHLDLNALFNAGLLAKYRDRRGEERYIPIGEEQV